MDGIAAMKMMRSTSSTSIIGVTLISLFSPSFAPAAIDMSVPSPGCRLIGHVALDRRHGAGPLVGDHAHDAHAVLRGDVERVDHLRVIDAAVCLHVEDLVLRALA